MWKMGILASVLMGKRRKNKEEAGKSRYHVA